MSERHRVLITVAGKRMLRAIGKKYGRKTYEILKGLIRDLEFSPELKGEPLRAGLKGLYSRHYSRFRVIYKIDGAQAQVLVIAAGFHTSSSRDDIYKVVERLLKDGGLNLDGAAGEE